MSDNKTASPGALEVLAGCACHKVRLAARAVTRSYDDALRGSGLRATQFAVLVAISDAGSTSITALAETLGMDRSTLARNLAPLQQAALVQIGAEGWRRSRKLAVTRKGVAILAEATPLWQVAQDRLRQQLGNERWATVHQTLEVLATAETTLRRGA